MECVRYCATINDRVREARTTNIVTNKQNLGNLYIRLHLSI